MKPSICIKRLLTIALSIVALHSYAQRVTTKELEINDPSMGANSDYTAIYRADYTGDRTRLRIRMGDEVTSDLEVGYHSWQNGEWTTTFSVDGYGNAHMLGNVGIGIRTLTERLNVNGKITAEEVKVVVDVPADYVFDQQHIRMPIEELASYVTKNRHLPNIPSANDLKENGWNLGEMSNKLLEKIEELTLYLIEMKKESVDQRKLIEAQQQTIEQLKALVTLGMH